MIWNPIATAPKDGTRVLVHWSPFAVQIGYFEHSYKIVNGVKWFERTGWFSAESTINTEIHPTHWMPLPKPPEAA